MCRVGCLRPRIIAQQPKIPDVPLTGARFVVTLLDFCAHVTLNQVPKLFVFLSTLLTFKRDLRIKKTIPLRLYTNLFSKTEPLFQHLLLVCFHSSLSSFC